jgi:uncharacterized protein
MTVISDTTALTNLLKIGHVDILKELFGKILIPSAVERELKKIEHHEKFINSCDWIEACTPSNKLAVTILRTLLGEGESEAIILAQERNADFLIIDELKGRTKAKELGVKIIGLLGVLLEAKKEGKISAVQPIVEKLQSEANFYIHPKLYSRILEIAGE